MQDSQDRPKSSFIHTEKILWSEKKVMAENLQAFDDRYAEKDDERIKAEQRNC